MSDEQERAALRHIIADGRATEVGLELLMLGQGGPERGDFARVTLHRLGVRWHAAFFEYRTRPQSFDPCDQQRAIEAATKAERDACRNIVINAASVVGLRSKVGRALHVVDEAMRDRDGNNRFRVTGGNVVAGSGVMCAAPLANGGLCVLDLGHRNDAPVLHP